jgi:hypothetical protein
MYSDIYKDTNGYLPMFGFVLIFLSILRRNTTASQYSCRTILQAIYCQFICCQNRAAALVVYSLTRMEQLFLYFADAQRSSTRDITFSSDQSGKSSNSKVILSLLALIEDVGWRFDRLRK